jgi:hypothetical protein
MEKLTRSPAQLAQELKMTQRDVGAVLPVAHYASFPDQAAYDALREEIAGKSTDAEKQAALREALNGNRFTVEAIQGIASTEQNILRVTTEARSQA